MGSEKNKHIDTRIEGEFRDIAKNYQFWIGHIHSAVQRPSQAENATFPSRAPRSGSTLTLYKQWPKWHPSTATAAAETAARKQPDQTRRGIPPRSIHGAGWVASGCQRSVRKQSGNTVNNRRKFEPGLTSPATSSSCIWIKVEVERKTTNNFVLQAARSTNNCQGSQSQFQIRVQQGLKSKRVLRIFVRIVNLKFASQLSAAAPDDDDDDEELRGSMSG